MKYLMMKVSCYMAWVAVKYNHYPESCLVT